MMGGAQKLNVYGRGVYTQQECNICSRIAFSKEIKVEFGDKLGGTNKNLLNQKSEYIDGKVWQYITNSPSNYMEGFDEATDFRDMQPLAVVYAEYNLGKIYEWATKSGIVAVCSFVPVVGPVVGAGIGGVITQSEAGDKISKFIEGLFNDKDKPIAATVLLVEYNKESLRDMKCTSFEGSL
jgi:hypothetical protein